MADTLSDATADLRGLSQGGLKAMAQEELTRAVKGATVAAGRKVPVRTGNLKGSIAHSVRPMSASVTALAPYAAIVEQNTPYLDPAVEKAAAAFEKRLALRVEAALMGQPNG